MEELKECWNKFVVVIGSLFFAYCFACMGKVILNCTGYEI